MKKIIYLCLITIISIFFGCSKDDINILDESQSAKELLTTEDANNNLETKPLKSDATEAKNDSTTTLPGNGATPYYLYLNMDLIEQNYISNPNNPSFSGPFNIYFRNLMSNHFTIYHIFESTHPACGNVERWLVNSEELNQYLLSIGIEEVNPDPDVDDWYKPGEDTVGGNTSDSSGTRADVNGNKNKGANYIPPPPPPPPNVPTWLINSIDCFGW